MGGSCIVVVTLYFYLITTVSLYRTSPLAKSNRFLVVNSVTPPVATLPIKKDLRHAIESYGAYVAERGGSRVIRKILVANNGMAATKVMLSMRQWAYLKFGDEKVLEFVAMASGDDLQANAEFTRVADKIIEVPIGPNKNNYANTDLIVQTAREQNVDAVWPGWGHASENPELPRKLNEHNIEFIGPGERVMSALGDKIAANILAQSAGVPSIPWSGEGLTVSQEAKGRIPPETFQKATVHSVEDCERVADKIGFPIMIKASEGGGGKGIRLCNSKEELKMAYQQVTSEVPNSPVFMMLVCQQARHIEVQIVGDDHGQAVALSGRDCSTQRRFQKIFEEGPPTSIVPPNTFRKMELAAQNLTQSIGYRGAGTVEYLYNPKTDDFYFLELNPRLQVEHPVTEEITNVNLPACQLQVSMGIPLHRIESIRNFWGRKPNTTDKIDFTREQYRPLNKHVIAARITAENPDEEFKPSSGLIERLEFQSSSNVWGYFSIGALGKIHEYADSQFGHLFASGPTREDARKALIMALKRIEIRGEVRTAVEYLANLLESKEFIENTIDTSWLDKIIREHKTSSDSKDPNTENVVVSALLSKILQQGKVKQQKAIDMLSRGNDNLRELTQLTQLSEEVVYNNVRYKVEALRTGPNAFRLKIGDGAPCEIYVREQADGTAIATWNGKTVRFTSREEPMGLRLKVDGRTVNIPAVHDPTELRCDVNGKLVRYLVNEGERVVKGAPYVEVEAMKMIMPLKAKESGILTRMKSSGSILNPGDLLATLVLDDASAVTQISNFNGEFFPPQETNEDEPMSENDTTILQAKLFNFMYGYEGIDALHLFQRLVTFKSDNVKSIDLPDLCIKLLTHYADVEEHFANGRSDRDATQSLLKFHNVNEVLTLKLSHAAVKRKTEFVLTILRSIANFPAQFPLTFTSEIVAVLQRLTRFTGTRYSQVALETSRLLSAGLRKPFKIRCEELKNQLIATNSSEKINRLAGDPTLSAGVDLLTTLFTDKDVKSKAREVYLRRIYRGHRIKQFEMSDDNEIAKWVYAQRDLQNAPDRHGVLAVLPSTYELDKRLDSLLAELPGGTKTPRNTCHIALTDKIEDESQLIATVEQICEKHRKQFEDYDVKVLNILTPRHEAAPHYFSFHQKTNFKESPVRRNMRPTFPSLMELEQLQEKFTLDRLEAVNPNSQVYLGTPKGKPKNNKPSPQTVFVRSICHDKDILDLSNVDRNFSDLLDELERAKMHSHVNPTASGKLYLNLIPDLRESIETIGSKCKPILAHIKSHYTEKLIKLNVDQIEVLLHLADLNQPEASTTTVRLSATSGGGQWLQPQPFERVVLSDQVEKSQLPKEPVNDNSSGYADSLLFKRTAARRAGSTYIYDFLGLLEVALMDTWKKSARDSGTPMAPPLDLFKAEELVLKGEELVLKEQIEPGLNDVGMVGWLITLKTPENPEGRKVVVIGNDITHNGGSFGVEEDDFFYKASKYARERGLPRIYLSCNSGARIGLYESLKTKVKPAWVNKDNPNLGFSYLYLDEEDMRSLPNGVVKTHSVQVGNETRHVLDAIIGLENEPIGVENLRGSGMIAGETSQAYKEAFTLTYVTGRSVGIGAYLVRLGQRTIQREDGPIVLTGHQALNKLLGRDVYESLDELGGPGIMHKNGVTHRVVKTDHEGLLEVLKWLSYVPKTSKEQTKIPISSKDPVNRKIEYEPTKQTSDPRLLFTGSFENEKWKSGFFDHDSFQEYLDGWARGVIVGRARLGGIPVGVIGVETRTVDKRTPPDPANPQSRENISPQAGQVWFPDSAFKTAQAINDFNYGENVPLFIFANWRGFSGGTRDMFDEILKYGAMIVDALRAYKHPVFVYIPPFAELRGGAWVVVDSTINPDKMEMYADIRGRGGILEPSGICEIKFREKDQLAAMRRNDSLLIQLYQRLNAGDESVKSHIAEREADLLPLYTQMAHAYADLHDRSGRMKAKGVINAELDWPDSRSFFYWRLRRRLAEDNILQELASANPKFSERAKGLSRLADIVGNQKVSSDWEFTELLSARKMDIQRAIREEKENGNVEKIKELLKEVSMNKKKQIVLE